MCCLTGNHFRLASAVRAGAYFFKESAKILAGMFGGQRVISYLRKVIKTKDMKQVEFIIERANQRTCKYKTFKFKTRQEGFEFLSKMGLLDKIIDVL